MEFENSEETNESRREKTIHRFYRNACAIEREWHKECGRWIEYFWIRWNDVCVRCWKPKSNDIQFAFVLLHINSEKTCADRTHCVCVYSGCVCVCFSTKEGSTGDRSTGAHTKQKNQQQQQQIETTRKKRKTYSSINFNRLVLKEDNWMRQEIWHRKRFTANSNGGETKNMNSLPWQSFRVKFQNFKLKIENWQFGFCFSLRPFERVSFLCSITSKRK